MSKTVEALRKIIGSKKEKEFSRIVEVDGEETFRVISDRCGIQISTVYSIYHDLLPTGLVLDEEMALDLAAALVDAVRGSNG